MTDTETRAKLSGPPSVCGGASITSELAKQRALASPPTLVLVPRRPRVVIGVIDTRCADSVPMPERYAPRRE